MKRKLYYALTFIGNSLLLYLCIEKESLVPIIAFWLTVLSSMFFWHIVQPSKEEKTND